MKKLFYFVILFCLSLNWIWAGGAQESAGSATRGKYMAARGVILPPEELHIHSYIASMDYKYSLPDSALMVVTLYSGHRQISIDGHHLSSPFRLSVRIITGNGVCSDGKIVILRPVQ